MSRAQNPGSGAARRIGRNDARAHRFGDWPTCRPGALVVPLETLVITVASVWPVEPEVGRKVGVHLFLVLAGHLFPPMPTKPLTSSSRVILLTIRCHQELGPVLLKKTSKSQRFPAGARVGRAPAASPTCSATTTRPSCLDFRSSSKDPEMDNAPTEPTAEQSQLVVTALSQPVYDLTATDAGRRCRNSTRAARSCTAPLAARRRAAPLRAARSDRRLEPSEQTGGELHGNREE
jgi:hypothetical protein